VHAHEVKAAKAENAAIRKQQVLLVEEENLIAAELAFMLEQAGYEIVGPAGSIEPRGTNASSR
jgi:hypothetical protein